MSDKMLSKIEMTLVFSKVLLLLYIRVLQHAQQSTEKEKEESEYANNKARCKAVLLFGFADFCLMFVVNNQRFVRFSNLIKPLNIKGNMRKF